jgi:ATP-dependent Zn protease
LEKVTKQAKAIVAIYGLNKTIGNITYYDSSGEQSYFNKPYSEHTAQIIDQEIKKIIDIEYARAKKILNTYKKELTKLSKILLEKEVIFQEDLENILGKRKWTQASKVNSKNSK